MAKTGIKAADWQVFLTSTGYIAMDATPSDSADRSDDFGLTGPLTPQPLSALVRTMLSDLQATPSDNDAAELAQLEAEFRLCLSLITQALDSKNTAE